MQDQASKLPIYVGLLWALGAPLLLFSPAFKLVGDPNSLSTRLFGQAYITGVVVGTVLIVTQWEGRPLSSLGFRGFHWQSVVWGLLAALALMKIVVPVSSWLVATLKLPAFDAGLKAISAYPVWFRVLAVVITGGLFEEIIYRGYAIERIANLTGSYWLAGILVVMIFAWMHYPAWGLGPVVAIHVTGGFLTAFYLWRQDIVANIIAHIVVDLFGIVIMSDSWRD